VEYAVDGRPPRWTILMDLSAGGAFLRGADDLARGTRLRLLIVRPGVKPLRIDAVVAWSRRHLGAGVHFVPADEALRLSIVRLSRRRPRRWGTTARLVSRSKRRERHDRSEHPRSDSVERDAG